jgi:hypothetical protein
MAISTRMPAGAAITAQLVAALCVLALPTTSSTTARTVSNQLLARIWACSSQEVILIWIPFINDRSIIKVLDTKFPYGFTRSEIVLISIGEGAGGGGGRKGGFPKICLTRNIIWRYHRIERTLHAVHTAKATPEILRCSSSNSIALYDLHDQAFSASDSERAFLTIDFPFSAHFKFGGWGFGLSGESRSPPPR